MSSTDFVLGLSGGLAISGVTYLLIRWLHGWSPRARASGSLTDARDGSRSESVGNGAVEPPRGALSDLQSGQTVPTGVSNGPVGAQLSGPELPAQPIRADDLLGEDAIQLSHPVGLHLYSQGIFPPTEIPTRAVAQAGMAEALRARQGALAGVLKRLVAAGVVESTTAHVRGESRRLKVYRLTDRGLELARSLRAAEARPRPRES